MKIAMIGHKRIPSREGGVEIVVEELATRLVQRGHQVEVYNRKGHHVSGTEYDQNKTTKEKYYKGIRVITIPTFENSSLNAIVYTALASFRALFGHYDVIHYHAEGPCSFCWLTHLFHIRTVATIHGLDWQRSKWGGFATKFLKFGEEMAVKYADEVIVLSPAVQQYFRDTYQRKTVYIPNGITTPEVRNARNIQQKYGLQKDEYLLFLARIVPEKGLHYLLEAYKQLDTDKKLVIAGGSSHTDEYLKTIQELASKDSRVILTGFVQGRELEELYSNAYLYILPSDIEGMPMSLLEAMSYGNACLVSDIPENVNVTGEAAFTFQKGNVSDLLTQLKKLIANPEEVISMKKKACDAVCSRFDWEDIVTRTEEVYRG